MMSIKYGERYVFVPVPVYANDVQMGTFLSISYTYLNKDLEPVVEVFKDCDPSKVGIGKCDHDLRANVATLIIEHRYGVSAKHDIRRLAHVLSLFNGVGVITVDDLDKIICEA